MGPIANLAREEKLGLAVAAFAHIALFAALILKDDSHPAYEMSERINVSLATEVSLESTAPDPSSNPAASAAPELSEEPQPDPAPVVEQQVTQPVAEQPRPPVQERSQVAQPTVERPQQPAPRQTQAPAPREQSSGTRLNERFLEGMSDGDGREGDPGDRPNPQQQQSILAAIVRQLKPHWNPPSGLEVDRLQTVVRFRLNRDGSLNGNPEVLRTDGQTSSNRAQVRRHQEQAVRAVRLAAPFNLPERFYSGWRTVEMDFNQDLAR